MKNGVHTKVKVSSCRTCASAKTRAVDYIAKRDFPFIDNSLLEQGQKKKDSNATDGFIEEGETVFDVLKALLACILSSLLKYSKSYSVQIVNSFRKIPKISPGAYIFQRPFLRGFFLGAYIRRGLSTEANLRLKIDWASLILERKFIVFALFYFVFESNFQVQAPGGLILTDGVLRYEIGGLTDLEGLIFGILRYSSKPLKYSIVKCILVFKR